MKVLIVGAGPTGLTTGVELARKGVDVKIIDRQPSGSRLSRAVGISPRSLRLLEPSGVTAKLLEQGIRAENLVIYQGDKLIANFGLQLDDQPDQYFMALAQDRTENILREVFLANNGILEYSTKLVALQQEAGKVSVTYGDNTTEIFDYLIGADGVRSTTRKCLGIDFPGYDVEETWSIADVDVSEWKHNKAFTFSLLTQGKVLLVAPLESRRVRLISNTEDARKALVLNLDITNVRREASFKLWIRQVEQYRHGRVFLAGDAAHCHSPVGGRGMNLGIADGVCLAACLHSGHLSQYQIERHPDGVATIKASEAARRLITSSNPLTRFGLTSFARLLNYSKLIQRRIALALTQS